MSAADLPSILAAKEAERRRLQNLPWLEKLEMLDKLRERHLWLKTLRPAETQRMGQARHTASSGPKAGEQAGP